MVGPFRLVLGKKSFGYGLYMPYRESWGYEQFFLSKKCFCETPYYIGAYESFCQVKREESSIPGFGSNHRQVSWALCRWRASPWKESSENLKPKSENAEPKVKMLSQKWRYWAKSEDTEPKSENAEPKKWATLPGGGLIVWRPEPPSHIFVVQNLHQWEMGIQVMHIRFSC